MQKNTIERHERAYSQFYEYALTQGETAIQKVLARSFLEEKENYQPMGEIDLTYKAGKGRV